MFEIVGGSLLIPIIGLVLARLTKQVIKARIMFTL